MREPFHTLMWEASIGYNDSWSQIDPEVLEKFAEAVIRRCGQTLVDNTPVVNLDNDWDKGYDRAINDCIHHIYEHFGVE